MLDTKERTGLTPRSEQVSDWQELLLVSDYLTDACLLFMPWICNTSCKVLKYCIIKKCKFASLRLKKSYLWGDMFSSAFMFCCTHSVKRPMKVPDFQTHKMSETLNVVPTWYIISLVTHPVLALTFFASEPAKWMLLKLHRISLRWVKLSISKQWICFQRGMLVP